MNPGALPPSLSDLVLPERPAGERVESVQTPSPGQPGDASRFEAYLSSANRPGPGHRSGSAGRGQAGSGRPENRRGPTDRPSGPERSPSSADRRRRTDDRRDVSADDRPDREATVSTDRRSRPGDDRSAAPRADRSEGREQPSADGSEPDELSTEADALDGRRPASAATSARAETGTGTETASVSAAAQAAKAAQDQDEVGGALAAADVLAGAAEPVAIPSADPGPDATASTGQQIASIAGDAAEAGHEGDEAKATEVPAAAVGTATGDGMSGQTDPAATAAVAVNAVTRTETETKTGAIDDTDLATEGPVSEIGAVESEPGGSGSAGEPATTPELDPIDDGQGADDLTADGGPVDGDDGAAADGALDLTGGGDADGAEATPPARPATPAASVPASSTTSSGPMAAVDGVGGPPGLQRRQPAPTTSAQGTGQANAPLADGEAGDPLWLQVRRAMGSLRTLQSGEQQMTIRLRPAELGSVMVRVNAGEQGTTVSLLADSAVAATQLAQQRQQLIDELEQGGLAGVAVDVDTGAEADLRDGATADERDPSSGQGAEAMAGATAAGAGQTAARTGGRGRRAAGSSGSLVDVEL